MNIPRAYGDPMSMIPASALAGVEDLGKFKLKLPNIGKIIKRNVPVIGGLVTAFATGGTSALPGAGLSILQKSLAPKAPKAPTAPKPLAPPPPPASTQSTRTTTNWTPIVLGGGAFLVLMMAMKGGRR